jgi:hypothetical protein
MLTMKEAAKWVAVIFVAMMLAQAVDCIIFKVWMGRIADNASQQILDTFGGPKP